MSPLINRRAIITGASSGIGKATAIAFAQAGFDLVLVSRSQDKLQQLAQEMAQVEVDVQLFPLDLAQVNDVCSKIRAIADAVGAVDVLINNAGIGYTGKLHETSLADWQHVMSLNLTSVFQCIQGVLPGMRDRQEGMIINIASIAAHSAFPGWGAYNVSKAGLVALSKTLAAEERSNGIRVVTVYPGAVNTPLWDTDTVQADFNRSNMLTPDTVAQSILHTALLPSGAVIEELTLVPSGGSL